MANFLNKAEVWIGYVLTIISMVSFVVALFKALKAKKYDKIVGMMIGFIKEAEAFTCKNGQSVDGSVKKEVVMSKIRIACSNLGYKFNEATWSKLIDEYVEFTLRVNQREHDKIKFNTVADVQQ